MKATIQSRLPECQDQQFSLRIDSLRDMWDLIDDGWDIYIDGNIVSYNHTLNLFEYQDKDSIKTIQFN